MAAQHQGRVSKTTVITLDNPIIRGEQSIETVTIRSPQGGELRGLKLQDVVQFDTDTIIKLVPRISDPILHPPEVAQMDLADIVAIGTAISDFLPQKGQSTDSPAE